MRLGLFAALILLAGCAVERNGVVRHVVIGFGVISVPKTNAPVVTSHVTAVGVYSGPLRQFSVGYVNGTTSLIDDNVTNVTVEIK